MSNFPTVQGMGGSLQEALKDRVKINTTSSGNIQHIRYDSYSGDWTFGKDSEEITGEIVTIITNSIVHGWHRWVDREVFKRMVSFLDDLPEKPGNVEDRKGKVQVANEARGFQCVMGEGEDSVQMSWEHSTDGCRRAIDNVLEAMMARAQEEAIFLYPVVKLGNDKPYENSYKDGEMIYPPTLELVGWRDADGNDAPDVAGKIEDKTEAKADKANAENNPPEDEEKENGEPPKRQRRRPRLGANAD